ncbi:NapC/NirT family cytochrome c [Thiocystis violacea]|uniref:NapC/NirT family cytochrome c n=1 Tax=Thiocystis violacea TaxID=13725 RepID=UPI0019084469|nr:NapC/NirT family cytochrome c [Thiocystis violacea]MBK1724068.1 Denitrification system component NirT [Thiocystis violacea]
MSEHSKTSAPKSPVRRATWLILSVGIVIGIIAWGGFNTAMEATNTEQFCISCHEMKVNVYQEYTDTIHYSNRTGVRATCPDCHVPKDWVHKVVRKIQASNELFHHFKGDLDTPAQFEAHRFRLAQNVWRTMKRTDSRECRNCHDFDSMDYNKQESRSSQGHQDAEEAGLTCIDCHKGIAHSLPREYDPEQDVPGKSIFYTRSE